MAGSIRSLSLNNIAFDVVSEAEFTEKAVVETEATATSGATIFSSEFMNPNVEGVQVKCDTPALKDSLVTLAKSPTPFPISFTTNEGSVYRNGSCKIGLGDVNYKTGIAEITLLPSGEWIAA